LSGAWEESGEVTAVYFGADLILHKAVEMWPRCDMLLAWHSDGIPLAKVRRLG
jgi:hypothetical protein